MQRTVFLLFRPLVTKINIKICFTKIELLLSEVLVFRKLVQVMFSCSHHCFMLQQEVALALLR